MAAKSEPIHNIIVTVAIELIGVGLLALLAGISDEIGRIIVIIMVGIAIVWALSHTSLLSDMTSKL
jgi:hypothetical protein